jgi:hypothetical protein
LQQRLANAAIVELKDNVDASSAVSIVASQQQTQDPAFPTTPTLLNNEQSLATTLEGEDHVNIIDKKTSSDSGENELWC